MDQEDDIMAGTENAPAEPTPTPDAAAPAPPASTADKPTESTSAGPDAPVPTPAPAAAADGWGDSGSWGTGGGGAVNGSAHPPAPAAPVQTEAQKREERRNKALGADEKKRGRRLFGGLLGTLDAFKKEERKRDASDAAKRRTQIANRIQTKLRSETVVATELVAKERELRTAKGAAERLEGDLWAKDDAYRTRHTTLRRLTGFLFTPLAPAPPPRGPAASSPAAAAQTILDLPSPIPLGQGALRAGPAPPAPLFYLPKELTAEQDERLARQRLEVDELVARETAEWAAQKAQLEAGIAAARDNIAALAADAQDLRTQKQAFAPAPAAPRRPPPPPAAASTTATNGWGEPEPAPSPESPRKRQVQEARVKSEGQEDEAMRDDDEGGGGQGEAWATGVEGEEVEY